MLKRLVTYFLLLNFLNTVFFCDNESGDYNFFNKQEVVEKDEINSVVEFVVEECLDIEDTTPEDEDDDCEDPFKTEKADKCINATLVFEYELPIIYFDGFYSPYYNSNFNKIFLEIKSPPPRRA